MIELSKLSTEQVNENSRHIDQLDTDGVLRMINAADATVATAVEDIIPSIEKAVDAIDERYSEGGRLIYVGSGSSGRMGVLDAAECPPTYGTDPERIRAVMAGGRDAVFVAVEGAEDDSELGRSDLAALGLTALDSVIGIAASGRTPYVLGALAYANEVGALTISLSAVPQSEIAAICDIELAPNTGPEVITGSTRMKSGTAQKFVLNMISTTLMIKQAKVYGNLMVDLKASNKKLLERCLQTVMTVTDVDRDVAKDLLVRADMHVKTAIIMHWHQLTTAEAHEALERVNGHMHLLAPSVQTGE